MSRRVAIDRDKIKLSPGGKVTGGVKIAVRVETGVIVK